MNCLAYDKLESAVSQSRPARILLFTNERIEEHTLTPSNLQQGGRIMHFQEGIAVWTDSIVALDGIFIQNPIKSQCNALRSLLIDQSPSHTILHPVPEKWVPLNMSKNNSLVMQGAYAEYLYSSCNPFSSFYGWGGYGEDRPLYPKHQLFQGQEDRTVHLGIDYWAPEETGISAPLNGIVHSVADNTGPGNYGPTILLEHQLEGITFYTLFGHLSRLSLSIKPGTPVQQGDVFAWLGQLEENGQWEPHLHFQIITHMLGYQGDFPGVAAKGLSPFWLQICPDPGLLIQFDQ